MPRTPYEEFQAQKYENGLLDVAFEVEKDRFIYVDKLTLGAASEPFRTLMTDRDLAKNKYVIKVTGHSLDNFYEMLTFVYSGKCNLNSLNIECMLKLSTTYEITELQKACDRFLAKLELNMGNIYSYIALSKKYSLEDSRVALSSYISKNFMKIIQNHQFMEAEKPVVEAIVSCKRFTSKAEEMCFQMVYKWSERWTSAHIGDENSRWNSPSQEKAIKLELQSILPMIDFDKMSLDFLLQFVVRKLHLFTPDELSNMLTKSYNRISKPRSVHDAFVQCDKIELESKKPSGFSKSFF